MSEGWTIVTAEFDGNFPSLTHFLAQGNALSSIQKGNVVGEDRAVKQNFKYPSICDKHGLVRIYWKT